MENKKGDGCSHVVTASSHARIQGHCYPLQIFQIDRKIGGRRRIDVSITWLFIYLFVYLVTAMDPKCLRADAASTIFLQYSHKNVLIFFFLDFFFIFFLRLLPLIFFFYIVDTKQSCRKIISRRPLALKTFLFHSLSRTRSSASKIRVCHVYELSFLDLAPKVMNGRRFVDRPSVFASLNFSN